MSPPALGDVRIGIIGLGYVGLPLAVYLARHFPVIGFDIDRERVAELKRGLDRTREVTGEEFAQAGPITYAADAESLREANFYIVTVPTPVDEAKRPDLSALIAASRIVGSVLTPGNVVVYEFDGLSRRHRGGLRSGAGAERRGSLSIAISSPAIRPSASIRATTRTAFRTSSRSPRVRRRRLPTSSIKSMPRSSPPGRIARARSAWPRPPR